MATEDPFQRLRAEIQRDDDTDVVQPNDIDDVVAAKAFSYLHSDDLHPLTHDILARVREAVELPPDHEERARLRVTRAMQRLREQTYLNPGELLGRARQDARVSEAEASAMLGINPAALRRLESGRSAGSLLNRPAESVADYVRRLNVNPRDLLAALFATSRSSAVYGYTPNLTDEERGRLLETASTARSRPRDRQWVLEFLANAERRR